MSNRPEEFVRQIEAALSSAATEMRPEVVEFRSHAEPLVEAYRGRRSIDLLEATRHAAWLTLWLEQASDRVRGILDEVEVAMKADGRAHL